MEIIDIITQALIQEFINTLIDVIKKMKDGFEPVHLLKASQSHGWQLVDRALRFEMDRSPDDKDLEPVKNVKILSIQLLYDVEDMLDKQNPSVVGQQPNMIVRFFKAVSQHLGLSTNNDGQLLHKLNETLFQWKLIFHEWDSTQGTGMDLEEKKCLAYFSLFPIDYQFNIDDLVHLWIGECFVHLNDDSRQTLKQSGEVYVMKLRERSILQPLGDSELLYKFNNSYYLDKAKSVAAGTCLHLDQYRSSLNDNIRHLSLSCDFNSRSWSQLRIPNLKLRTLLSLYTKENKGHLKKILLKLEKSLSLLRVLSLRYTTVRCLPSFMYELLHLRYLDISFTKVKQLPTNFHKRYPALQFLKINQSRLSELPTEEFHHLTNLRHVDWEEPFLKGTKVPARIGSLTQLENLPLFQVGTKDGYFISELKEMNNLQGSLCIQNLECVYPKCADMDRKAAAKKATNEAKKAMLHEKCGLKRIALHWELNSKRDCACDEHILKGLQPHRELEELKIENYRGNNLPAWISNSEIKKVSLLECRDCYLPALGKMKNLETLVLEDMRDIRDIGCLSDGHTDTGGCFPKLKTLKFHNMTELEKWTGLDAPNVLPCLEKITFDGCISITHSLPFIRYLIESKQPTPFISNDGECLRCIASSDACPHN